MPKMKRIRWSVRGTVFLDAIACPRDSGDEDILPIKYAEQLVRTGLAKFVDESIEDIPLAEVIDEPDDPIFS